jgi:hypothetical protein
MELLLKLVILCQYNSQIHRVPAGRIVTNKQTKCPGQARPGQARPGLISASSKALPIIG